MKAKSRILAQAGLLTLAVGGLGLFTFAQDNRKIDAEKIAAAAGTSRLDFKYRDVIPFSFLPSQQIPGRNQCPPPCPGPERFIRYSEPRQYKCLSAYPTAAHAFFRRCALFPMRFHAGPLTGPVAERIMPCSSANRRTAGRWDCCRRRAVGEILLPQWS